MPDRLAPPTRYEMLLAAERAITHQISEDVLDGRPTGDLVAWRSDLLTDIRDFETQMLGLWRLTRSEAHVPQDREEGAPDASC